MNKTKMVALSAALFFSIASIASAHVVVKPASVGIGSFQTFTMGVPVEKDIPTISLRLVIPEGLEYVSPNVKPGWKIDIKKDGTGADAKVTEIDWTGGSIPVGQRDDFVFSAKVPAQAAALSWKAYQTYSDGSVVSWDQNPSTIKAGEEGNPYSITKVEDNLTAPSSTSSLPMSISIAALALAAFSFVL